MSTQTHISQCLKLLALHSPSSQILSAKSLLYRGWPLYLITLDQITSTMLLSENWPEEQTVGSSFCFLARRQTQGKGQGENKWETSEENFAATYLIRTSTKIIPYLHLLPQNAIIDSLNEIFPLKTEPKIKWINDIYLDDKKVAGILTKTSILSNEVVLQFGIGININSSPLSSSTCIKTTLSPPCTQIPPQTLDLLSEKLFTKLLDIISHIEKGEEGWGEGMGRMMFVGEGVEIWDHTFERVLHEGVFVGVAEYGFALLRQKDGTILKVQDGRMRKKGHKF